MQEIYRTIPSLPSKPIVTDRSSNRLLGRMKMDLHCHQTLKQKGAYRPTSGCPRLGCTMLNHAIKTFFKTRSSASLPFNLVSSRCTCYSHCSILFERTISFFAIVLVIVIITIATGWNHSINHGPDNLRPDRLQRLCSASR